MIPDAVQVAIAWLDAHPSIVALAPTVAGDLVGYTAGVRWLSVTTNGGSNVIPFRLDAVGLDINAYAESRPTARRLCAEAVSALWQMRNHTTADAVVCGVEVAMPPADLTDLLNHSNRFVADVTVYIRPR